MRCLALLAAVPVLLPSCHPAILPSSTLSSSPGRAGQSHSACLAKQHISMRPDRTTTLFGSCLDLGQGRVLHSQHRTRRAPPERGRTTWSPVLTAGTVRWSSP
ncbi:hypothetical protein Micbo1qcDRAFT_158314, partial [Microdochium bolleyi]